jgi:hypothetical protein
VATSHNDVKDFAMPNSAEASHSKRERYKLLMIQRSTVIFGRIVMESETKIRICSWKKG